MDKPTPSKKPAVIKALLLLAANAAGMIVLYKKLAAEKPEAAKPVDATRTITINDLGLTYAGHTIDWHILFYGALLIFFLLVLFQVILDKQPWNALFTKQLFFYMAISFAAIALICFVVVNWLTAMNVGILVLGGIFLGYLIFRLTSMISGKQEKLP